MTIRVCPKCGAEATVERSGIRRTLYCPACKFKQVKNIIAKGGG